MPFCVFVGDGVWTPETPDGCLAAKDKWGRQMVLMRDDWAERYFVRRNPEAEMSPLPFEVVGEVEGVSG